MTVTFLFIPLALLVCRYLQKEKVHGPEGNSIVYELAERSLDEAVSGQVKEYISQVYVPIIIIATSSAPELNWLFFFHSKF